MPLRRGVDARWSPLIRSNITLNLGLRYEVETKIWGEDRNNNTYYPRPLPFVDFASRGDKNNWSPRVGLAWDLRDDGQSVVRLAAGPVVETRRVTRVR